MEFSLESKHPVLNIFLQAERAPSSQAQLFDSVYVSGIKFSVVRPVVLLFLAHTECTDTDYTNSIQNLWSQRICTWVMWHLLFSQDCLIETI